MEGIRCLQSILRKCAQQNKGQGEVAGPGDPKCHHEPEQSPKRKDIPEEPEGIPEDLVRDLQKQALQVVDGGAQVIRARPENSRLFDFIRDIPVREERGDIQLPQLLRGAAALRVVEVEEGGGEADGVHLMWHGI